MDSRSGEGRAKPLFAAGLSERWPSAHSECHHTCVIHSRGAWHCVIVIRVVAHA
jgi:hypothetical protein